MSTLPNNLIKEILSQIKTIVQTTLNSTEIEYREELVNQLKENGYDYFNGGNNTEAAHVIKILALAINNDLVEKFDIQRLQKGNSDELDRAVEDLGDKLNVEGSVKDSLLKKTNWSSLAKAKCPLAFAKFLKKNGSEVFVRRLIEHQYEIKWATKGEGGRPEPFNFYDFCDKEQSLKYLQYNPRTAHTKVTLYQECFKKSPQFSKHELCPDVYVRTTDNVWMKVTMETKDHEFVLLEEDLGWMDRTIRDFISTKADKIKFEDYEASLQKKTLYLAVIDDDDFRSRDKLELNEISRCQGYVGKANNGILGRWLKDSGSHCEKMKRCIDNVNAMAKYDPLRLQGIQLVDARLALGKVRKEKCALFVMETFGDKEELEAKEKFEKNKEKFEKAKEKLKGIKGGKKKLRELKIKLKMSEGCLADKARREAIENLENTETEYREGICLGGNGKWHLKDMKFGMNNK